MVSRWTTEVNRTMRGRSGYASRSSSGYKPCCFVPWCRIGFIGPVESCLYPEILHGKENQHEVAFIIIAEILLP